MVTGFGRRDKTGGCIWQRYQLRVCQVSGDQVDVTFEDDGGEGEVIERVVETLAEDSGALRSTHGDRLMVLYGRGVALIETAPRGAVL